MEKVVLVGQKAPVDEAIQQEFLGLSVEETMEKLAQEAEFAQTQSDQRAFVQRYLSATFSQFDQQLNKQEKDHGIRVEDDYQMASRVLAEVCQNPASQDFFNGEMSESEQQLFLALYPELIKIQTFADISLSRKILP